MELSVNIKRLRDNATLPAYATPGSAAADLHAAIDAPIVIPAHEKAAIPTGIAISPSRQDVVALVFGRSGMGCKKAVTLANSVGVIDADYRGEILVTLINHGSEPYTVAPNDRIAQIMFVPIYQAAFLPVDTLDETVRGEGGFGSTGK